jgi:hypothetical protein
MTHMLTPAFDVAQVDKEHSDRELPRKQVFLMCGPSTFYLLPIDFFHREKQRPAQIF